MHTHRKPEVYTYSSPHEPHDITSAALPLKVRQSFPNLMRNRDKFPVTVVLENEDGVRLELPCHNDTAAEFLKHSGSIECYFEAS